MQAEDDKQERPEVTESLKRLLRQHTRVGQQDDDANGDQKQRDEQATVPGHRAAYRRRTRMRSPMAIRTIGQKRSQRKPLSRPIFATRK